MVGTRSRPGARARIAFTLGLLVAKLVLVWPNEIVAEPYDSWMYVVLASAGPFSSVPQFPPGYFWWLWLGGFSGIPQRLLIELLYVASASLLASRITNRLGFAPFAITATLAVFWPPSYTLFDHALSDGFYCCLSLFAIAFSLAMLDAPAGRPLLRHRLALGACLGFMLLTRHELPLIVAAYLLLLVALFDSSRRNGELGARQCVMVAGPALMVSVGVTLACVMAVCAINLVLHGTWAVDVGSMRSHEGFLGRLASIEVTQPQRRFVPISREARFAAYAASPTLARLQPIVEAPQNQYQKVSRTALGVEGEIGAGWIWHVFTDAAYEAGIREASALDRMYVQINRELDAAFESGRLHRRFVLDPLLGQHPSAWAPFLPSSILHVAALAFSAYPAAIDLHYRGDVFDAVLARRAWLVQRSGTNVHGWQHGAQRVMQSAYKSWKTWLLLALSSAAGLATALRRRPDARLRIVLYGMVLLLAWAVLRLLLYAVIDAAAWAADARYVQFCGLATWCALAAGAATIFSYTARGCAGYDFGSG